MTCEHKHLEWIGEVYSCSICHVVGPGCTDCHLEGYLPGSTLATPLYCHCPEGTAAKHLRENANPSWWDIPSWVR